MLRWQLVFLAADGCVDRICFPGRRKAIALRCPASRKPGAAVSGRPSNACVRPLAAAGELSGLLRYSAKSLTPRPKLGATLGAFSDAVRRSPCCAQKAGDLPSWQIPLSACAEPCFARPGKQTSIHSWLCVARDACAILASMARPGPWMRHGPDRRRFLRDANIPYIWHSRR